MTDMPLESEQQSIHFRVDDRALSTATFLNLVNPVWPGNYDSERTEQALLRTLNITAWAEDKLVGTVRVLSDGYFFGTIPEILVDPAYQRRGIGRRLMDLAWEQ
jgi:ribosomal protein S18 acetylase RimI-like enzyme